MLSTNNIVERKTKTPEHALASLMRLASRSEKSSGDALRLMHEWGVSDESARAVLKRLIDDKFIDDQRFALSYVREKTRLSGWGSYKIRAALNRKGIASETIDRALEQLEDRDKKQGEEKLKRLLKQKMNAIKTTDQYEMRNKLIRYGLSQGHKFDKIVTITDKLFYKNDE